MRNLLNRETQKTLIDVYELAEEKGITVCNYNLPKIRAVSLMDDYGNCFIGLDDSKRYSVSEEKTMLIHELGHCETGAFYNKNVMFSDREKCEYKAKQWAIVNFIPYDKLIEAYKSGICEKFELAEHFCVSEQFIETAIEYYLQRGMVYGT